MAKRSAIAVFDSSALIIVAKINALVDWLTMYGHLLVPPQVEHECVGELVPQSSPDVQAIRAHLQNGILERVALNAAQMKQASAWHENHHLGLGECQTLAYVHTTAQTIALVEDRRARALARAQQIPYTTIQMSPLEGYIRKKLSLSRAVALTDQIALAMHSDLALVNTLQLAIEALARARGDSNDSIQD